MKNKPKTVFVKVEKEEFEKLKSIGPQDRIILDCEEKKQVYIAYNSAEETVSKEDIGRYTFEQLMDALFQSELAVMYALEHQDRELLESEVKQYLEK